MKRIALLLIAACLALPVMAQTDSIGVYSVRGTAVDRVEALNYKQTKITVGKAKLVFPGATSPHRFTGVATFRLYFGTPSPYEVNKYFMFTPAYSANDFSVGKFEVKNGDRYLTTARVSIYGAMIGASEAKGLTVESVKLHDNAYELTISGPAGEYCIMPIINGAAGYCGVFDFTIE